MVAGIVGLCYNRPDRQIWNDGKGLNSAVLPYANVIYDIDAEGQNYGRT